jgi:transposase
LGYNFVPCDRNQDLLLAPSLEDWLPAGHLARFLIDVVGQMNVSAFYRRHRSDGWGRAAYEPAMMVTLLFYACCTGSRSSRSIERRCAEDIACRYITAGRCPDHATISRFRADHEQDLKALFKEGLRLCVEAGLVKVGVVALDGTKVAANAAGSANRTAEAIEAEVDKMFTELAETDAVQDSLFGEDRRGDELPEDLSNPKTRLGRLRAAKKSLDDKERVRQADYQAKQDRVDAAVAQTGRRPRGRPPKPPEERATQPSKVANVTDPDSRIMKRAQGFIQGYNAQAVVTENQIVVATDVTQDADDHAQLEPMLAQTQQNLLDAGATGKVGVLLADAGYCSEENLLQEGPELLIATTKDAKQRSAAREAKPPRGRIPKGLTPRQLMERKLATKRGRKLYRRRSSTVEPVFGQHRERGLDHFSRRGLEACRAEWAFENTCHNLMKLFRSGKATRR